MENYLFIFKRGILIALTFQHSLTFILKLMYVLPLCVSWTRNAYAEKSGQSDVDTWQGQQPTHLSDHTFNSFHFTL